MKTGASKKRINLLPRERRAAAGWGIDRALRHAAVACAVLCVGLGLQSWLSMNNVLERESQALTEDSRLGSEISARQTAQGDATPMARLRPLMEVMDKKLKWSDAFKEMSTLVDDQTWVEHLETQSEEKSLTVRATGLTSAQEHVAEFMSHLENSYYFRDAVLKYSERKKDVVPSLYQFEFAASLHPPAGGQL